MKGRSLHVFLSSIFAFAFLFGCKKEEKVLSSETGKNVSGTWYTNEIIYQETIDNQLTTNIIFNDPAPSLTVSEIDKMPSQINLIDDGTYWSVSHTQRVYFATVGNIALIPRPKYNGTWLLIEDGKKMAFDKGVYEFEGKSTRVFDVKTLNDKTLTLSTSKNDLIYDWTYQYGRQVGVSFAKSAMAVKDTCSNGAAFGNDYGAFLGYYDATKSFHYSISPFFIGRARGLVDGFVATYDSTKSPKFHTCFKSNLQNLYQANFDKGKSELNVKNRKGIVEFNFTR